MVRLGLRTLPLAAWGVSSVFILLASAPARAQQPAGFPDSTVPAPAAPPSVADVDASAPPWVDASDAGTTVPAPGVPDGVVSPVGPEPIVAPIEPAPTPLPDAAAPPSGVVEVTVRGGKNDARTLQNSAEAVTVVSIKRARKETADLGEVLARTQGVGVRRVGGLGSEANISLAGMQGEQIRELLDGLPLHIAGFPFGLGNIPVGLVERIEVYRGVVPVRFGADALGGAINVVTDDAKDNALSASYHLGSFGLRRASLTGNYLHEPSGFLVRIAAFDDSARNDFLMRDRQLWQPDGTSIERDVKRFHDEYRAQGGNVELGVIDKRWARRLTVQPFYATFAKDLQHNIVMSTPFGAVRSGETIYGATLRYGVDFGTQHALDLTVNYARREMKLVDLSLYRFDWTGDPSRPVGTRAGSTARGELTGQPIDDHTHEESVFGRATYAFTPHPQHILRASVTPQFSTRYLDDRVAGRPNRKLAQSQVQVVGGAEYEANLFAERLSNIAFVKAYVQRADTQVVSSALTGNQVSQPLNRTRTWGAGDSLRHRFSSWALAKLSYEYAARLPRPDELFGNGALIDKNIDLEPERSHNLNVGPRIEALRKAWGELTVDLNFFFRDIKDMIILLPTETKAPYRNVANARSQGLESALSYTTPGRWLTVDGSHTWQDLRNTSATGPFAAFKDMRIPSRPWMFASWGGRGRVPGLPKAGHALEPFYYGRSVHKFDRGWPIGSPNYKMRIPAQTNHSVGITYTRTLDYGRLACTVEVDNLTNTTLYDYFGVQRPGRSYNLKLVGDL